MPQNKDNEKDSFENTPAPNIQADQWIDPAAHTEQWLHPMVLEQVEEAVSGFSYMTVDSVIVRTFIVPFEKWGLLEVERIKEGYFDKIQRIRKTPLFDAFIRFES